MEQIDLFRKDLEALGVIPVLNGDSFCLEYSVDEIDQKAVNQIINKYVGFWKSIAIKTDHSREERIARYKIPVKYITGEDITEEQLMTIAHNMSKKIIVPGGIRE
jgi:hypothetical protein